MTPILSILVCSVPDLENKTEKLRHELLMQRGVLNRDHHTLGEVEILHDGSKRFLDGGLSIGAKRDGLKNKAKGKYLTFLDCDDLPAPNYLETLVRMCHENKDVVTFRDFTKTDFYWTIINMSLKHTEDEQATPERIVKRRPWLVCPVRSEYAKKFSFPDTNYGEDAEWMSQVLTLCETEVHTDQILRSYQHSSKTSEADKITNHAQSKR